MVKIFYKIKENIFAFSLSIIIHVIIVSFFIYNINYLQSMVDNTIEDNKNNEDDNYVILIDPIEEDIEEELEEKTRFVSDKNIQSSGEMTAIPNFFPSKWATLQKENLTKEQEQKQKNTQENLISLPNDDISDVQIYRPETDSQSSTDKKIPSSFDEGAERAIVFSSKTGQMRVGTKALPYYWYFRTLVNSISKMWNYTIPNQAHFLGLIRSDEVEILLSIDKDGTVEFVDFLRKSTSGQNSLNNSCQKAIEYTGNIGEPPTELYEDYQENGKIYIPFRFIYQNYLYDE